MTPQEYTAKIQEVIHQLDANREPETLRITFDLMAQVKDRIQSGGTDYLGRMFAPYTPDYAKYGRIKMGYQSRYVDFTRDGRLWASITPFPRRKTVSAIEYEVAPRDAENQDKLNGQYAKRGNILKPSEEEIEAARQANNLRAKKYLDQLR